MKRKKKKKTPENEKANDIWVRALIAVVTFLIGGALLLVRHYTVVGLEDARNWTPTTCTITNSEFVFGDEGGRWLELTYRYGIAGVNYTGDRLDMLPGRMGNDDDWETEISKANPVGSQATCYVDPTNHANSVLDNKRGAANTPNLLLLSMPFLAIGTVFLYSVTWSLSHKKAMHEASIASIENFGNPPRHLSLKQIFGVLMVPQSVLIAMGFFVGFMLLFRILEGPAIVADMIPGSTVEAQGTITKINTTGHNQFNGNVMQYKFDYEFDGKPFNGTSFSVNNQFEVGDDVTVLVDPENQDRTRIDGFRRRAVPFFVTLIPASVLALLAFGIVATYLTRLPMVRLFRHGAIAQAELKYVEETHVVNPNTRHEFRVGDDEFIVNDQSMLTADLTSAFVLYDPANPHRNIGLSAEKTALLTTGLSLWKVFLFSVVPPVACIAATIWIWML